MKKVILAATLLVCGCTVTHVAKNKDGSWTFANNSFLMQRSNVKANVETNGAVSFSEDKMTPDQQTLSKALDVLGVLSSKVP